jgi:hypothetical protein
MQPKLEIIFPRFLNNRVQGERMLDVSAGTNSQLVDGLNNITTWVKTWGIPLAAIGTISMALLETAKNIFPLRRRFQESRFCAYLTAKNCKTWTRAEQDLVTLAAAGDRFAFYNSEIEQMCGHIKNVLTAVLDYPKLHADLINCLASTASADDLGLLFEPPHPDIFLKGAQQSTAEEREAIRKYAAAKMRIAVEMRCAVDAVQNSIAFRWKQSMRVTALILSGLVGAIAINVGAAPGLTPSLGATLIIGVLAGFLAPVARDLVAAVESWRG